MGDFLVKIGLVEHENTHKRRKYGEDGDGWKTLLVALVQIWKLLQYEKTQ